MPLLCRLPSSIRPRCVCLAPSLRGLQPTRCTQAPSMDPPPFGPRQASARIQKNLSVVSFCSHRQCSGPPRAAWASPFVKSRRRVGSPIGPRIQRRLDAAGSSDEGNGARRANRAVAFRREPRRSQWQLSNLRRALPARCRTTSCSLALSCPVGRSCLSSSTSPRTRRPTRRPGCGR